MKTEVLIFLDRFNKRGDVILLGNLFVSRFIVIKMIGLVTHLINIRILLRQI